MNYFFAGSEKTAQDHWESMGLPPNQCIYVRERSDLRSLGKYTDVIYLLPGWWRRDWVRPVLAQLHDTIALPIVRCDGAVGQIVEKEKEAEEKKVQSERDNRKVTNRFEILDIKGDSECLQ